MTCIPGKHDWQPAPAWLRNHGGAPPANSGYEHIFCWRCRIDLWVKARKEVAA